MGYDVTTGLKFAFGALHDRQVLIWTGLFAATMVASAFVSLALMFILPTIAVIDLVVFGMPLSTLAIAAFVFAYGCALALATLFFNFQFTSAGMRLAGYEPKEANFLQYLLVIAKAFFLNLFSWYDKKVLAAILVIYAITLLWIGAGYFVHPLMVAAGFGLLGFAALVHYLGTFLHGIRTSFAPFIYIKEGKMGPISPKRSFTLVKGQTIDVLLALLGGGIVFGMVAIPGVLLAPLLVGYIILALAFSMSTLYMTNVFKHFDEKGVVQKQTEKPREKDAVAGTA